MESSNVHTETMKSGHTVPVFLMYVYPYLHHRAAAHVAKTSRTFGACIQKSTGALLPFVNAAVECDRVRTIKAALTNENIAICLTGIQWDEIYNKIKSHNTLGLDDEAKISTLASVTPLHPWITSWADGAQLSISPPLPFGTRKVSMIIFRRISGRDYTDAHTLIESIRTQRQKKPDDKSRAEFTVQFFTLSPWSADIMAAMEREDRATLAGLIDVDAIDHTTETIHKGIDAFRMMYGQIDTTRVELKLLHRFVVCMYRFICKHTDEEEIGDICSHAADLGSIRMTAFTSVYLRKMYQRLPFVFINDLRFELQGVTEPYSDRWDVAVDAWAGVIHTASVHISETEIDVKCLLEWSCAVLDTMCHVAKLLVPEIDHATAIIKCTTFGNQDARQDPKTPMRNIVAILLSAVHRGHLYDTIVKTLMTHPLSPIQLFPCSIAPGTHLSSYATGSGITYHRAEEMLACTARTTDESIIHPALRQCYPFTLLCEIACTMIFDDTVTPDDATRLLCLLPPPSDTYQSAASNVLLHVAKHARVRPHTSVFLEKMRVILSTWERCSLQPLQTRDTQVIDDTREETVFKSYLRTMFDPPIDVAGRCTTLMHIGCTMTSLYLTKMAWDFYTSSCRMTHLSRFTNTCDPGQDQNPQCFLLLLMSRPPPTCAPDGFKFMFYSIFPTGTISKLVLPIMLALESMQQNTTDAHLVVTVLEAAIVCGAILSAAHELYDLMSPIHNCDFPVDFGREWLVFLQKHKLLAHATTTRYIHADLSHRLSYLLLLHHSGFIEDMAYSDGPTHHQLIRVIRGCTLMEHFMIYPTGCCERLGMPSYTGPALLTDAAEWYMSCLATRPKRVPMDTK
jgi:hypothetical protein